VGGGAAGGVGAVNPQQQQQGGGAGVGGIVEAANLSPQVPSQQLGTQLNQLLRASVGAGEYPSDILCALFGVGGAGGVGAGAANPAANPPQSDKDEELIRLYKNTMRRIDAAYHSQLSEILGLLTTPMTLNGARSADKAEDPFDPNFTQNLNLVPGCAELSFWLYSLSGMYDGMRGYTFRGTVDLPELSKIMHFMDRAQRFSVNVKDQIGLINNRGVPFLYDPKDHRNKILRESPKIEELILKFKGHLVVLPWILQQVNDSWNKIVDLSRIGQQYKVQEDLLAGII
jgi:hypothetical protein